MAIIAKPAVVHGIFQRLRVVRDTRRLDSIINEYVDQAAKRHAIDPMKAMKEYPNDAAFRKMIAAKKLPLRPNVDFVPSEQASTVFVGGFLRKFAPAVNSSRPMRLRTGWLRLVGNW